MRTGEQEPGERKSQAKRGYPQGEQSTSTRVPGSGRVRGPGPASGRSTPEEGRYFRAGTHEHWKEDSKSARARPHWALRGWAGISWVHWTVMGQAALTPNSP